MEVKDKMAHYSWNTKKVKDGFRFNVTKTTSLKKPDKRGYYAKIDVVKTGVRKTRARAKGIGQRWMLYLNSKARKK